MPLLWGRVSKNKRKKEIGGADLMSEEILGFKKEDASDRPLGKLYGSYTIHQDNLVPVVSVEWLEKWLQEHEKNRSQFPNTAFIWVDNLLEAVRLQENKAVEKE